MIFSGLIDPVGDIHQQLTDGALGLPLKISPLAVLSQQITPRDLP